MTEVVAPFPLEWADLAACKDSADPDLFFDPDEEPPWQDLARCTETDPEIFFVEKGGSTREARAVCQGCEVRAECLQFALDNNEQFGIYGGMSPRERRALKSRFGDDTATAVAFAIPPALPGGGVAA